MIIESLQLIDFRVFQGRHEIDLAPRVKYNKKRPIILFGGLNGAGKTSILLAIRLGLFGKQALGYNVSQKAYEDFLSSCIHRAKDKFLQSFVASVEIRFSYASMGILKRYIVKREWMLANHRMVEKLTLIENDKEMSELSKEQCQGFLNELIPIGIADLFFFDGEKIAELADDTAGSILGDAIKKLLGLDLLETLQGDLSVILRNKLKETASFDKQETITELENKLLELESRIEAEETAYGEIKPALAEIQVTINHLNGELSTKGGAWASSREKEMAKYAKLEADIDIIKRSLQEAVASSYPLIIAAGYAQKILVQLKNEQQYKLKRGTATLIQSHLNRLKKSLNACLSTQDRDQVDALLMIEFAPSITLDSSIEVLHDISDSTLISIETSLRNAIQQQEHVTELTKKLHILRNEYEGTGKNIARAPVEEILQPLLNAILSAEEKKATYIKNQEKHLDSHKMALREAINVTKQLDKLTNDLLMEGTMRRTITYASGTKALLKDFSSEVAKQKVAQLEDAFAESFSRLARKDDMMLRAKINHKDFSVRLVSKNGNELNKNELSAGEKQIYAISILEALAKTSGRHLPIIIDTPLGRLDSVHRSHLVNEYFPNASHQVVILSTDTEVDEHFYGALSPNISHAYRLEYEPETNSTTPHEGYFWKHSAKQEGASHAA
jgi:DNA sulfur modification protein DndD